MEVLRDISEELKTSYMDYAMSVIVGRALPDVRDGLKPVQRRILYAMFEMGLTSNRPYRKCARIVGEVLGKYHPHGDAAVYDALVRLAQDFVMRYPLIDGQGNFGSIDGDSPAAMRYTEARLARIADEMLADINRETVDFIPNFDSTLKEPVVLPAKLPNLLVNGSSGIAVGMATNMPPHNLAEICNAIIACIKNPDITVDELMRYVKGPDFPTGGTIVGKNGIEEAYKTGRGKITIRGRAKIEDRKIIIEEIPYMVNKAKLVESIAELAREGKIDEIRNIRDESDREGIRVVVELRGGADPNIVLKKLYAYTNLQTTFGIIMLALVENEPRILTLKELIESYIEHRRDVIRRRTSFELRKAKERLHILEGLKKAVEDIDNAIQIIKSSPSPSEAKTRLMDTYNLTEIQADAILQMRLQKLTAMEIDSLMKEYEDLKIKIAECETILSSPKKVDEIITKELQEVKEKYGDKRRTEIIHEEVKIQSDELIKKEENILIISSDGFVKRMALDEFRLQARGGVGVIAANLTDKDTISVFSLCNSYDKLLLFTNTGRVFWVWAHEIPKMDRTSRGVPIRRYIRMNEDERIVSALSIDTLDDRFVVILSPDGYIKKVRLSEFENAKRAGIKASVGEIAFASILEGDVIFIVTRNGYGVKLSADTIPEYGRVSKGVIAVRLRGDDEIAAISTRKNRYLLTLTENGYGKRTSIKEFKILGRGAMGVIAHRTGVKTGKVVFADMCDGGELFTVSEDGYCIRSEIASIPVRSRNSAGVIVSRKGITRAFVYPR
jgi:DNA gyrase subunit A